MSLISVILLLAAGAALAMLLAALRTARGLRADVAALRRELTRSVPAQPAAAPDEELIRAAVADALADEREREVAEARAFWAEQEARDAAGGAMAGPGPGGVDEAVLDALLDRYLAGDDLGIEPEDLAAATGVAPFGLGDDLECDPVSGAPEREPGQYTDESPAGPEGTTSVPRQGSRPTVGGEVHDEDGVWSAEVAAARRRHPSHPGYSLTGRPLHPSAGREAATDEHHRTGALLTSLAEDAVPLADVRPGPLGTLDVLLFEDGTTLCLSPGHRATAERLAAAVRAGEAPVLLGGSGVCGAAYALTFGCGDDSVYLLADRVVAP